MEYYSPLRYPGGKNKMVTLFKKVIDANGMRNCVYVEPFAGGASVALSLLMDGYAERVIINDADPSIYAFWFSCLNHTQRFCELLNDIEISTAQWEIQKNIYRVQREAAMKGDDCDFFQLGFSTFYLNRANRSGILKGGVIGGKEQSGKYLINARFNKTSLVQRIRQIGLLANRIELHNEDAKQFLLDNYNLWSVNTLVYCDPPYVKKGKGLYMNYFTKEDHKTLANAIAGIDGLKWVITYDVDPLITEIYQFYRVKKIVLSYSAHTHTSKAEEFIIFSDLLTIPEDARIIEV